ncbi:hypothetical protein K3G63_15750 [Hymenobacter sp. HSC-4F20]|uniref:hypothetical protein n=1 Tax=Hymenobacter sp. HSC-4F20 TaxID=2864135 RepID=UPI001C72A61D|nr:hypothetical protein [Hymenobacter sp. HSC-4F20]MBX0291907.1 hypothetical protein [Hymenobacter sp. HSC-4F20]
MIQKLLLLSVFLCGAQVSVAQIITDPARAVAARDSLLNFAGETKLAIQQQSAHFKAKTSHLGARRHVVEGFLPGASGRFHWKHKTIQRRNGAVVERYIALQQGRQVLRERRLNGVITYLQLQLPLPTAASNIPRGHMGMYMREGYLRWNKNQYVLPVTTR